MGSYNLLHASLICPRCGVEVETDIQCHFGYTANMADLRIGDRYPWRERKQPQNGGRPEHGTVDGEGYMECDRCHKDAFLRVLVRDDCIVGVEPDPEKPGYISD
jgi:uncharacterized metal-binding protein YceD (DUF177 family)